MTIEKIVSTDRIEILANGTVQVRKKIAFMEDGQQKSGTFHRHVVTPGDDYSGECERVQAICAATHTPEVIEAYQAAIAAQGV